MCTFEYQPFINPLYEWQLVHQAQSNHDLRKIGTFTIYKDKHRLILRIREISETIFLAMPLEECFQPWLRESLVVDILPQALDRKRINTGS